MGKGLRVTIVGKHPWKGECGLIIDTMDTPVGYMWKVRLDNGMECGVKDRNIRALARKDDT